MLIVGNHYLLADAKGAMVARNVITITIIIAIANAVPMMEIEESNLFSFNR